MGGYIVRAAYNTKHLQYNMSTVRYVYSTKCLQYKMSTVRNVYSTKCLHYNKSTVQNLKINSMAETKQTLYTLVFLTYYYLLIIYLVLRLQRIFIL